MVGARWTEFVIILLFRRGILSAPQNRENSIQDRVGNNITFIGVFFGINQPFIQLSNPPVNFPITEGFYIQ